MRNGARGFQLAQRFGIRRVFVDRDHTGRHRVGGTKRFREKAFGCLSIWSYGQCVARALSSSLRDRDSSARIANTSVRRGE